MRLCTAAWLIGLLVIAAPLHAQPRAETLTLTIDGCDASWLETAEVARAVVLEAESVGLALTLMEAAPLEARVVCGMPESDDALSLRAQVRNAQGDLERVVSVADVAGPHRVRVVAMVVAEMIAELAALPARVSPSSVATTAPTEDAPPIALERPALAASSTALSRPWSSEAHEAPLTGVASLGAASMFVPRQSQWLAGLSLELADQAAWDAARLRFGTALSAVFTEVARTEGVVDAFALALSLFVEGGVRIDSFELGARAEVRPGLFVSAGRNAAPGHASAAPIDAVLDVTLLAFVQLHVSRDWFLRAEAGATFVASGVRVRIADEEVLAWTDVLVPIRVAVGANF